MSILCPDMTVILAPYYFSHKLSLQLAGANIHVCPFEKANLRPQWEALDEIMQTCHPKLVITIFMLS